MKEWRMHPSDRSRLASSSLIAVLLVMCLTAFSGAAQATPEDAAVRRVALQLQCPVCEGQSVADSSSGLARDMRALIRSKQAAGENDQQILDEFVGSYGDGILSEPPKRGISLGVWLAPIAALGVATAALANIVSRWRRTPMPAPVPVLDPLVAGELRRFRQEAGQ
jgi:cytochrome c-type biogenesis protein CcmH